MISIVVVYGIFKIRRGKKKPTTGLMGFKTIFPIKKLLEKKNIDARSRIKSCKRLILHCKINLF